MRPRSKLYFHNQIYILNVQGCPTLHKESVAGQPFLKTNCPGKMNAQKITKPSYPLGLLKRLPLVREYLRNLRMSKRLHVSAKRISNELLIEQEELIKDISSIGIPCQLDTEFAVNPLIDAIEIFLGFHKDNQAFIVGSGLMAELLINQLNETESGFKVVAAFDRSEELQKKTRCGKMEIIHLRKLKTLAERMHINIGIIATTNTHAQEAASLLEDAGINIIWNLSTRVLKIRPETMIENTNLLFELASFSKKIKDK